MPKSSWSHKMLLYAVWLLVGLQIDLIQHCTGAQILNCDTGSVDAVEGDTSFTLTCDLYSGNVTWQYESNPSTTTQDIGTCTEQLCQVNSGLTPFYQLQWLNPYSNRLEFYSALVTSRNSSGFTYKCGDASCVVQVTVPAELGTPSVVLSRPSQGQPVTVTGTVDITRVYSSRGEYNCTWIRQQGGQSSVVTTKSLFPGPNVNKEDRSGRCDVTDSLDRSYATYTYKVLVYPGATEKTQTVQVDGPDSASIPESPVFYTDSTGSHSLTLTCTPRDVNPTTVLTYQWTGLCSGMTSDRCTFRPSPPDANGDGDEGATVQCQVTNPLNNKMAQASFVLQLKYPPRVAPNIQGYTNNQILYQGDIFNINCTVAGGEPPVTSVTWTCTGHSQDPSTGQSSSLSVTSLSADGHDAVCTCSARWIKPEYYTLTATRTLTVYSPPSEPDLRRTDGRTKPYLEGETVTLTCSVTSSGHPTANLTWSRQENGVIANPDRKTSTLRLLSVGKEDHLRTITCHAVNDFTQHKQLDLSDVETLRVYYGPYIAVDSSADNTCIVTSDPMTCTTIEGQRIHLRSHADSMPPPQRYVWQTPDGSNLDPAIGGDLDIVSINRTQSGVYRVQVSTTKPDVTDYRLPLTSHRDLTVLVKYTASDVTFGMNINKNLTINESDRVTFDCQSHGRPTPELQLTQSDTVLQRAEGGKLSLSEVSTRLSHTITAQCNNTGLYTCSAHNDVGDTQQDTAELYVNCSPRQESAPMDPPKLNYKGRPVQLSFNMVAFPLPDTFTFLFHGPGNNVSELETSGKLHSSCWNPFAAYALTCIVMVNDITQKNAGFYSLQIGNSFGHSYIRFEVTYFETYTESETEKGSPNGLIAGAAIGIGVTLALVLVIAGVVVVCLWRRHWVLPCASSSVKGCNSRNCHQQAVSPRESAAQEGNQNANIHEMQEETPESQNQYEPLRLQDIGAKSEYADFTPRVNAGMTSASGKGAAYANTRLADVKV